MLFAQQHIFTQWGHTFPITNTPHYKFLQGDVAAYEDYLKTSWQFYDPNYSIEELEKRVLDFRALELSIKSRGIGTPIKVYTRPNGDTLIFDGNHRAAIGTFLDINIPKEYLKLEDVIRSIVNIPHVRYGSQVRGLPYQSIYSPDGEVVFKGRRSNLKTRSEYIQAGDIMGKDIVDVGCNYGNALMLTHGAKTLTGADVNLKILTAAVRLAVIFRKPITYKIWDINTPPNHLGVYDTAFIFSVDAHLKTLANLIRFIKHNVKNIVYYETHVGHELPKPIRTIFSSLDLVGKVGERDLYRCVL